MGKSNLRRCQKWLILKTILIFKLPTNSINKTTDVLRKYRKNSKIIGYYNKRKQSIEKETKSRPLFRTKLIVIVLTKWLCQPRFTW
mgnify:CR=1 FL=1